MQINVYLQTCMYINMYVYKHVLMNIYICLYWIYQSIFNPLNLQLMLELALFCVRCSSWVHHGFFSRHCHKVRPTLMVPPCINCIIFQDRIFINFLDFSIILRQTKEGNSPVLQPCLQIHIIPVAEGCGMHCLRREEELGPFSAITGFFVVQSSNT